MFEYVVRIGARSNAVIYKNNIARVHRRVEKSERDKGNTAVGRANENTAVRVI